MTNKSFNLNSLIINSNEQSPQGELSRIFNQEPYLFYPDTQNNCICKNYKKYPKVVLINENTPPPPAPNSTLRRQCPHLYYFYRLNILKKSPLNLEKYLSLFNLFYFRMFPHLFHSYFFRKLKCSKILLTIFLLQVAFITF